MKEAYLCLTPGQQTLDSNSTWLTPESNKDSNTNRDPHSQHFSRTPAQVGTALLMIHLVQNYTMSSRKQRIPAFSAGLLGTT